MHKCVYDISTNQSRDMYNHFLNNLIIIYTFQFLFLDKNINSAKLLLYNH